MIPIKKPKEIEIMMRGGKMLAEVLYAVVAHAQPGVTEIELDQLAERLIREKGGEPGFKRVEGYSHTVCVSTNDVVVHGIPTKYALKEGDIIGVDCGVFLEGFHTDMAETVLVGKAKDLSVTTFLETGKRALLAGIAQAKPGNHVGDISHAIQAIVEGQGYSVVRSLVGHGVGRELHEEPEVPGYLTGSIDKTPKLTPGMTIAIEVIYNMGEPEVVYDGSDDWTIRTEDGSLGGLFERSVLITKTGHTIITEK